MPEVLISEPLQLVACLPDADVEALAEALVAFANADGGTLYVGLDEQGRSTGAVFPDEFEEVVRQAELRCRPPVPVRWEQSEAHGAFVFVGVVQRSSELHALADGRVLVRAGAQNRPLAGDQVRQLASTRTAGEYEAEPVAGATRDDFDPSLTKTLIEGSAKRRRPLSRLEDDVFIELGWLTRARVPTVAGMLLFGKSPQTFLPRSGLVFVRFDGAQVRQLDGETSYGRRVEVEGALSHVIDRAWSILEEEIHQGAVVTGLQRKDQWMYPRTAIREALVNAVAHRDYRLRGRAIEVRMFADRLEIISPGGLPGFITLDNLIDEHYSRNPRIVNGLYQWGYIEELGLGIDLMVAEMANAGHPVPEFYATEHSFTVVFRNAQSRKPAVAAPAELSMNERQAKALTYIQDNGRITNRDYQSLCSDVSAETLRLDLADLVERGLVLKIGEKRGTYYILK